MNAPLLPASLKQTTKYKHFCTDSRAFGLIMWLWRTEEFFKGLVEPAHFLKVCYLLQLAGANCTNGVSSAWGTTTRAINLSGKCKSKLIKSVRHTFGRIQSMNARKNQAPNRRAPSLTLKEARILLTYDFDPSRMKRLPMKVGMKCSLKKAQKQWVTIQGGTNSRPPP